MVIPEFRCIYGKLICKVESVDTAFSVQNHFVAPVAQDYCGVFF